jgi:hypothetical protein
MQQGNEQRAGHQCNIFRACLTQGYIPTAWRQVKLISIPKQGKANYTKAYPMTLSCFMLKMIEGRLMRDEIMRFNCLHQNQFAYQPAKSTETALHTVDTNRENIVEHRQVELVDFYILRASDSTTFEVIIRAAEQH